MRRFQFVFEESEAREVEALAREYGLTEQAVLEQLVALGLEQVREDGSVEHATEH
ncbi:CopG family transcriptional regulator [Halorarius litoreus]|uniref:CopG family transcriptional regulator n=1 Tax=Halorarius litoreus TaxID=2962676 RepID=UPI0020CD70CF|nr:CopG family transcriptional regulator [Halorarius litoreus]